MNRKEILDNEVTRIYERDGKVAASVLLEEQTPPDAPLHDRFEWDDSKAGHEYRLDQARKLIRVARVVVGDRPSTLVHVAKVENADADGKEGYYKPVSVIIENMSEYTIALESALIRLQAAKREVEELERVAKDSEEDVLARIAVAMKALSTAETALQPLH